MSHESFTVTHVLANHQGIGSGGKILAPGTCPRALWICSALCPDGGPSKTLVMYSMSSSRTEPSTQRTYQAPTWMLLSFASTKAVHSTSSLLEMVSSGIFAVGMVKNVVCEKASLGTCRSLG